MIDDELNNGGVIHNYNSSDDYIKNLSNLELELCMEIIIKGKKLKAFYVKQLAEKINFHNLRLLEIQNIGGKILDRENLAWYFVDEIQNTYMCFFMFNKKFKKFKWNLLQN
jgi:hypothetical protein